jgi:hypothetical protein
MSFMPTDISEHFRQVKQALAEKKISVVTYNEEWGHLGIGQYCCKVGAPWSGKFKININTNWFADKQNHEKPEYRNQSHFRVDWYLFCVSESLLAVDYENLRGYADKLEKNRDRWTKCRSWGLVIDDEEFHWVGNGIRFPLKIVKNPDDLEFNVRDTENASSAHRSRWREF